MAHCDVIVTKQAADKGEPADSAAEEEEAELTRIEGRFAHGMAHGRVKIWYKYNGRLRGMAEGTFRMGLPHGTLRFSSPDGAVPMGETKFLYGRPLDLVDAAAAGGGSVAAADSTSPKLKYHHLSEPLMKPLLQLLKRKILI